MSLFEFFSIAFQIAVDTVRYLFAYAMTPVLALVAAILLRWTVERKKLNQSLSQAGFGTVLLVAIGRAPAQEEIVQALRQLTGKRLLSILYLVCSHNLLLYYFFLVGPLLGKDVLLSHVIGTGIFLVSAILMGRILRFNPVATLAFTAERKQEIKRPLQREAFYSVGWGLYGLFWGSLIGAWGLSPFSVAPAEIGSHPVVSQLTNAALGGVAAIITNMWPVAVLFAGTYLWKTGLAHAGLIVFFLATTITPQRCILYRKIYSHHQAARLILTLCLSALFGGFMTALFWHLTGLQIRYRLLPEQLWQ